MRIGVLTGGGDAPGLNAAIRAVTRRASIEGWEILGFRNGWLGVLERDYMPLDRDTVIGILPRGGTILGSSRTNPYRRERGAETIVHNMEKLDVDALVAIGGDDTLGVARRLSQEGVKVVGISKTIDNDIPGTDYSIGFFTAVGVVTNALDSLHPTAEAHHRIMIVEVMGRDAGWIATMGGLAGGADLVLIPEVPFTLDQVVDHLKRRHEGLHRTFSIIVIAEGASIQDLASTTIPAVPTDEFGHERRGGIGQFLAERLEDVTGYECRVTVLGHLQRGGSPSPFDRILATRQGVAAVELIKEGAFGVMVGLKDNHIAAVPLEEAEGQQTVDLELYRLTQLLY